ncbi:hypothetical protein AX767_01070 [Variovorax sp. PAMC 28711]|nr:hypothetical protein AX767_01070 [Variovorax sp. PAMC 28711]
MWLRIKVAIAGLSVQRVRRDDHASPCDVGLDEHGRIGGVTPYRRHAARTQFPDDFATWPSDHEGDVVRSQRDGNAPSDAAMAAGATRQVPPG